MSPLLVSVLVFAERLSVYSAASVTGPSTAASSKPTPVVVSAGKGSVSTKKGAS